MELLEAARSLERPTIFLKGIIESTEDLIDAVFDLVSPLTAESCNRITTAVSNFEVKEKVTCLAFKVSISPKLLTFIRFKFKFV